MTFSSTNKICKRKKQLFRGTVCNMCVAYYVYFAAQVQFCWESDQNGRREITDVTRPRKRNQT